MHRETPVSYTHLDVYKRQDMQLFWKKIQNLITIDYFRINQSGLIGYYDNSRLVSNYR